jgi:hypothetical protein
MCIDPFVYMRISLHIFLRSFEYMFWVHRLRLGLREYVNRDDCQTENPMNFARVLGMYCTLEILYSFNVYVLMK